MKTSERNRLDHPDKYRVKLHIRQDEYLRVCGTIIRSLTPDQIVRPVDANCPQCIDIHTTESVRIIREKLEEL